MSRDIRSFFQVQKAKKQVIEDDDDVIPESPDVQIKNKKKQSRKKRVLDDDSDEEIFAKKKKPSDESTSSSSKNETPHSKKNKVPNKPALKEIKAVDLFGSGPIKRTEPLVKKVKKNTETGIHSDEEFEKSLLEVDAIEEVALKEIEKEKLSDKNHEHHRKQDESKAKSPSKTNGDIKINAGLSPASKEIGKHKTSSKNHEEHRTAKKDVTTVKSPAKTNSDIKMNPDSKSKESSERESSSKESSDERKSHKTKETNGEFSKISKKAAVANVFGSKKDKRRDTDSRESTTKKDIKDEHNAEKKKPNISFRAERENGENSSKKDLKKRDFSEFVEGNDSLDHGEDTPKNKKKRMDKSLNESVLTDEERHERKMHSAALYQKYLNRSGPKHLGAKQIPEGSPNCLANCAFLLTGVLDSFEREEVAEAITKLGGCIKNSISKKVTHLIAGEDAGPAKTAKARDLGIPVLNEDQFLELIVELSNKGTNNKSATKKEIKTEMTSHKPKEATKEPNKPKENVERPHGDVKKESSAKNHDEINTERTPSKTSHKPKDATKESHKSKESIERLHGDVINESSAKNHDEINTERTPSKTSYKPKDATKESHKSKESIERLHGDVRKESSVKSRDASSSRHIVEKQNEGKSETPGRVHHGSKTEAKPEIKSEKSKELKLNQNKMENKGKKIESKPLAAPNASMWVDKYKPQNLKQIIGQHGDASNVKKLSNWLTKWYVNRKAKLPKPSPWAKTDDGGFYKAVLLSGPPGVGKTTTVSLVCKELGFDLVEFNASDTRNKSLIKEQIGELLSTTSLAGYAKGETGKQAITKKHVLVMDEVDGMAGNEDRGGLQELIALIKSTSVPVICMCNDRNSQKMRSLVNYCYDLRFSRPRVEQIRSAMMSICCKEGLKIPGDALTQLIVAANQDVRQTLNLLSMWAVDSSVGDADSLKRDAHNGRKDVKLGPWEAIRKVFAAEEHKGMSLSDRSDLFFYDYSLAPLFVQENYLQVAPHCPKHEVLERISKTADSISAGDLVDVRIRRSQAWGLLPLQAMYSSVIPGQFMAGHVTGQIQFPGWLGKNSRATKMHRLCQEIHAHTRLSTSGSKSSIFLDYSMHIRDAILTPLLKERNEGVQKSLEVLEAYHLLRDDLDSLTELSLWPGQRNPMILIDSKVKAAMTRTYNKTAMALPYAPGSVKRGRTRDGLEEGEDDLEDDEGNDSDPENDALIKKKKVEKPSAKQQPSTSKKSSSKKEKVSSTKPKKK